VCAAAALSPPGLLLRVNDGAGDVLRRAIRTAPPDPRVVIVDIDERSVAELGQWPWRRDRLGTLVERLQSDGAGAIAFDLVFSEPDRSGAVDPSGDAVFAQSLGTGNAIVGYAFTFDRPGVQGGGCELHPFPLTLVQPRGTAVERPMFEADGVICSLPALTGAAGRSGFLNATPDADGTLRRVPLVIGLRGAVYPSLALAAALPALGSSAPALAAVNANSTSLALNGRTVPLDGRSNLLLRFRGARRTFPFVPAADVIAGRVAPGRFRDAIVFVGATALGTQELVATPQDPRFIGVEVQATVADNLLQGDFLSRPADAPLIEAGATIVAAGLLAFVVARFGLAWAGVVGALLVAGLWGGAWWVMGQRGLVLSPVVPTGGVLLSAVGLALATMARSQRAATADLQRARADADAAAHAHEDFLTTLSRELRTPLSAIQGYAKMVGRGALADDTKVQVLAAIERHALAQTQLIDDLFDASRAAGGRLRLVLHDVELGEVVRSILEALRPAIEARRLVLTFDSDGDVGRVSGDPERLRRAVWHLLSNAVKFTPEGGQVDVRLMHESGTVALIVRDSGPRIPADEMATLFTARAGGTRAEGPGLRLGLPLVRHIVELHGGSITATSDGHDTGASFRVQLPLKVAAPSLATTPVPVAVPRVRLDGVRVVVVDEHADARGRIASTLLEAGAAVVTAASSQDALALMRDDSRDVLIVTIGTSERNGYWLAREALAIALNRGERLGIIAVGGEGHSEERARMPEVTIERHLTAPVDLSDLVSVVADVARVDNHHAH
jgi:signal transduction histidine kinase